MSEDEKLWAQEAIALCKSGTASEVTVLFIRKASDENEGEADIIVTNAKSPELVAALNGNYESDDSE